MLGADIALIIFGAIMRYAVIRYAGCVDLQLPRVTGYREAQSAQCIAQGLAHQQWIPNYPIPEFPNS